jgi:phage portal protein BeeE
MAPNVNSADSGPMRGRYSVKRFAGYPISDATRSNVTHIRMMWFKDEKKVK